MATKTSTLSKSSDITRNGSILPLILNLESELIEHDRQLKKSIRTDADTAQQAAAQRIGEAENDLPGIESEERKKLQIEVNASVEERSSEEDRKYNNLQKAIEKNRKLAVDHILKQVLPDIEHGQNL